jgi:hypothetical protein
MGIFVVNTTENRDGFENAFCKTVASAAVPNADVLEASGDRLIGGIDAPHDCRVVVFVSHAGPAGPGRTYQDGGIGAERPDDEKSIWNNPTVISQLLRGLTTDFVLVFCACEAASLETYGAALEQANCRGVVASDQPVMAADANAVGLAVDDLNRLLQSQASDADLRRAVLKHLGSRGFNFMPAPRVSSS